MEVNNAFYLARTYFIRNSLVMNKFLRLSICSIFLALALAGCATTSGNRVQEKRQAVLSMKNDVLAELFKLHPQAKNEIASAPSYAVFRTPI